MTTTRSRRRIAALASAAAVAALTPAVEAAPPAPGLVLRGSRTASVVITTTAPWHFPGNTFDGGPHSARFSGEYGGFMIEEIPEQVPDPLEIVEDGTPFQYPIVIASLWHRRYVVPSPPAVRTVRAPVRFGGFFGSGGTLDPGTYRVTLFADRDTEVVIRGNGAPRAVHRPTTPVAASVRVADLPRVPGSPNNLRAGRIRDVPIRAGLLLVASLLGHWSGQRNAMTSCILPPTARDMLTCPERANCFRRYERVRSGDGPFTAPAAAMTTQSWLITRQRVVTDGVTPESPLGSCRLPEGQHDAVWDMQHGTPIAKRPSVALVLVVDYPEGR